jgi:hypothetical protein
MGTCKMMQVAMGALEQIRESSPVSPISWPPILSNMHKCIECLLTIALNKFHAHNRLTIGMVGWRNNIMIHLEKLSTQKGMVNLIVDFTRIP